jgi:hypothetical protein
MQAPLSKRARRILADPTLAKQLMQALLLSRDDREKHTINLDGKQLHVVRVGEIKNRR